MAKKDTNALFASLSKSMNEQRAEEAKITEVKKKEEKKYEETKKEAPAKAEAAKKAEAPAKKEPEVTKPKTNDLFKGVVSQRKRRVVLTLDEDIASFMEEQNKQHKVNNLSKTYNIFLREFLKEYM